jgi:diaminopimelate decarboxylase/aspartate kinase
MKTIVAKFGGSSLCKTGVETIINRIHKANRENYRLIIVVSAIQRTTNNLLRIINCDASSIHQIIREHNTFADELGIDKTMMNITLNKLSEVVAQYNEGPYDVTQHKIKIISYGEILSSVIVSELLKSRGIKAYLIDARQFIKSVNNHNEIDPFNLTIKGKFYCDTDVLKSITDKQDSNIYVTQGFIASTADAKFCILSRSGSDTSASIIAAGVKATQLEIWTDVNGMFTADPNMIEQAMLIKTIGYDVCQEMSTSGSRVLHPYCIDPCKKEHIPIHVNNTFDPDGDNTIVNGFRDDVNKVYAISTQNNVTVFHIKSDDMWESCGFVHDIYKVFKENNIDVNIITTSPFSIKTTTEEISREKLEAVKIKLSLQYEVDMMNNCSIVSIVAKDIFDCPGIENANRFINALGRHHLHIKHNSANNMNVSFVVDSVITKQLVQMLHKEYIESR